MCLRKTNLTKTVRNNIRATILYLSDGNTYNTNPASINN